MSSNLSSVFCTFYGDLLIVFEPKQGQQQELSLSSSIEAFVLILGQHILSPF